MAKVHNRIRDTRTEVMEGYRHLYTFIRYYKTEGRKWIVYGELLLLQSYITQNNFYVIAQNTSQL